MEAGEGVVIFKAGGEEEGGVAGEGVVIFKTGGEEEGGVAGEGVVIFKAGGEEEGGVAGEGVVIFKAGGEEEGVVEEVDSAVGLLVGRIGTWVKSELYKHSYGGVECQMQK